ncbi:hypothetical protein AB0L34_08905 [Micromonospora sp. NPDC052213]
MRDNLPDEPSEPTDYTINVQRRGTRRGYEATLAIAATNQYLQDL